MKKFFGGGKPKPSNNVATVPPKSNDPESPISTPIHAVYTQQQQQVQRRTADDEDASYHMIESFPNPHPPALAPSRSSSYGSLPPGASPPAPRPPSPPQHPAVQTVQEPTAPQTLRRKNPNSSTNSISTPNPGGAQLSILRTLEPQHGQGHVHAHQYSASNEGAIMQHSARPSMTIDPRFASVNSIATASLTHEGGEHTKDKDKNKKDGGWFSKLTGERRDDQKEREREHRSQSWQLVHHEEQGELTQAIGFLTATASEDWALVLDVCERASANEANAKEAIRALKKEFKYGEPPAQLSAARLWAIMLRNSSEMFIGQSTSRKFLETLEDLLLSSRTSPVVKERVLDVLAAAAYASGSKKDTGFRGLWKKVKPHDKPDEGMPFDTDDSMFNPPILAQTTGDRHSYLDQGPNTGIIESATYPDHQHLVNNTESHGKAIDSTNGNGTTDSTQPPKDRERHRDRDKGRGERRERDRDRHRDRERDKDREPRGDRDRRDSNKDRDRDHDREHRKRREDSERRKERKSKKRHKSPSTRIIPVEEDIRRLFQECVIGKGNAGLLSQALVHTVPEDFDSVDGGGDVIKEFRLKCISSQELIAAQIPWATAGAERSRREMGQQASEETTEEKLLGDLLAANEELMSALKQYEDLERVAMERKAEEQSKADVGGRGRRPEIERQQHLESLQNNSSRGRPSRSSSPPPLPLPVPPGHPARVPSPSRPSSRPSSIILGQPHHLAPPAAPHGPRSPGLRTPSPGEGVNGLKRLSIHDQAATESDSDSIQIPIKPSEKALGKRRCDDIEDTNSEYVRLQQQNNTQDEFHYNGVNGSPADDRYSVNYNSDEEGSDGYGERGSGGGYNHHHHHKHPPVMYVYDAAAERTKQRLLEGRVET
ncbi:hypothetical protein L218DRAFT_966754 [Marasmius fiardii PR-910]|nr:hypothetical protein L218DRAFT_966754 [Marasmius fiardii PR-910]